MRRSVALLAGVLVAITGLAIAQSPSIAPNLDVPDAVLVAIGVAALGAGVLRARSWLSHDPREISPAERERRAAVTVPGDDLDTRIRNAPPIGSSARDTRLLSVREDLRSTGIEVLVRYRGYTPEEAEDLLDSGRWTEDELAREFFASRTGTGSSVPSGIARRFRDESPFFERANRAAAAIERLTRGDRE